MQRFWFRKVSLLQTDQRELARERWGVDIFAGLPVVDLVAPYRATLRYYRCNTPYRAILFKGGYHKHL